MIVHEYSTAAAVDPQAVWDRWTRIDAWPVDSPNIIRARLNGPVAQGAVGWVKPRRGPRFSFRIVEADRMAGHFFIEAKPFLGTIAVDRLLARADVDDEGRQLWTLTHRVIFRGPMGRFWNKTIGRTLPDTLPGVVENVAAIAAI